MKKFYLKMEDRNEEEKRTGKASYKSIIDRYISDLVLCNNIAEIDDSIWDNMNENDIYYIDDNGEYRTREEYENDETGTIEEKYEDIYQYFLCNLSEFDCQTLTDYGIILTYSDKLDCDVLCVNHCGTSWDYVSTNVELTENIEEVL